MTDPFDRTWVDWKRAERRHHERRQALLKQKTNCDHIILFLILLVGFLMFLFFGNELFHFYHTQQKENQWHSKLLNPK